MKKLMIATAVMATSFAVMADYQVGVISDFEGDAPYADADYWSGENDGAVTAYETAPAADNANYLAIDASEVYMRNIQTSGEAYNLADLDAEENAYNGVYIDTSVQFTASEDAPTPADGDKLVVWLRENADVDPVTYTLMVTAAQIADNEGNLADDPVDYETDAEVVPGTWYNLKINALSDIGSGVVGFTIAIDNTLVSSATDIVAAEVEDFTFEDSYVAGKTFPSLVSTASLTGIGFKGTGAIDNLQFCSIPYEAPAAETAIPQPVAATGLVANGATQVGVAAGTGYEVSGDYQAIDAGTYVAHVVLLEGYYWDIEAEGEALYAELDIEWTIAPAEATDEEKAADDKAAVEAAKAGTINIADASEVTVEGQTITIKVGDVTTTATIASYYTATVEGTSITLALNDNALPEFNTSGDDPVVEIDAEGNFVIQVSDANANLWYGLKTSTDLSTWTDDANVEWVSGDALSSLKAAASDTKGFYKIVVTDVEPAVE